MKSTLLSAPSAGLASPMCVAAERVRWQGYLSWTGLNASHVAVDAVPAHALPAVAGVSAVAAPIAAVPFAAMTLAATATVEAVAGTQQVATAPKQADKPVDNRNDVFPLGNRPGEPPS